MSRSRRPWVAVVAFVALSGCAAPAGGPAATTPAGTAAPAPAEDSAPGQADVLRREYTDFPALVAAADAVVIGTARSARVRTVTGASRGGESPPTLEETYTRVQVEQVLAGDAPAAVEVSQFGSAAAGPTERGIPLLTPGRSYLLFLTKGPLDNYEATGGRAIYERDGAQFRRITEVDAPTPQADGRTPAPIPDVIPADQVRSVLAAARTAPASVRPPTGATPTG